MNHEFVRFAESLPGWDGMGCIETLLSTAVVPKLKRSPCVYPLDRERRERGDLQEGWRIKRHTYEKEDRTPLPCVRARGREGKGRRERLNSQILARGLRALLMTNDSG